MASPPSTGYVCTGGDCLLVDAGSAAACTESCPSNCLKAPHSGPFGAYTATRNQPFTDFYEYAKENGSVTVTVEMRVPEVPKCAGGGMLFSTELGIIRAAGIHAPLPGAIALRSILSMSSTDPGWAGKVRCSGSGDVGCITRNDSNSQSASPGQLVKSVMTYSYAGTGDFRICVSVAGKKSVCAVPELAAACPGTWNEVFKEAASPQYEYKFYVRAYLQPGINSEQCTFPPIVLTETSISAPNLTLDFESASAHDKECIRIPLHNQA